MKTRALCTIAVVVASLMGSCRAAPSPTTVQTSDTLATATVATTAPSPPTASAATTHATNTQASAGPVLDGAAEECDSFTIALDRLVFIRLQPIVEEAADLLHSAPDHVDPAEVATGLMEASRRLFGLVEELDLMGVPPREIVDLLLSIREGILAYAAGFDEGSRGWASGDAELIAEARADVLEASAVLTEFFGWQLCP
ncbi:MAG: hypothetical protein OXM57_05285 [bacterium]|nr:hypothetical protein [bacterium]MDE0352082.1 hypothetical protein [bacterium]